ncbi:MAG: hypothetical protein KGI87_01935 [Burkholderiales bacterium]|nr:hypothetical protein [Burkholderiales bacterium]
MNRSIRAAIGALLLAALAACGGGGTMVASTGGGVGTGGTGISMGTVTGFGSVVLDGTAYSSATPQYFAGTDRDEARQVTSAAVELGGQLQIQLDAQGNPSTVLIAPELMGPVSTLSAAGFTVNGVPVRVNTDPHAGPVTYYTGLANYAGLAVGMQLEVHGAYGVDANGQGYIQATLIEQLLGTNTVTRITGMVTNLNASAGTFQIDGLTVHYDATTSVLPAGMNLAAGQMVNVWSNVVPPSGNGVVAAGVIHIRTLQGVSGPVQIGGLVSKLSGTRFEAAGVPIDAGAPALAGVLPSLAAGAYVVVQGQSDAVSGVVMASGIRAYATQPAPVELSGTITSYVGPANFLVRGVPVDASHAQFLNGASPAALGDGVFVDVVGSVSGVSGNIVTGNSVAVLAAVPDGATVDYQGIVSQLNRAAGSFVLTWQHEGTTSSAAVTLAPNVAFGDGTASQLIDGAGVEIEATNTASGLVAYTVSFHAIGALGGEGTGAFLETSGLVYEVTPTSFVVNGLTIQTNGVTPQGGMLVNGAKVEVNFSQSGALNLAQAISIDP